MKVVDIADEIFRDLNNPTDLSVPQIAFWLLGNIGQLNILIEMEYVVVNSEFVPELGDQEKDILKKIYFVKWANNGMTHNLGATAYDWSEISEGDSTVRRVSRNEIAKTYKQLRDTYQSELNELAYYYKKNKISPSSYDIRIEPILGFFHY